MNATHVKFIREKLIPFILRDQGQGFDMSEWITVCSDLIDYRVRFDEITEELPGCGTMACIGGSIEILTGRRDSPPLVDLGETIGLNEKQAEALFFGWDRNSGGWPEKYQKAYRRARTRLDKARVACELLEKICKTEGKCLDSKPRSNR